MDKLRKIVEAVWNVKERIVFAVMLCVLGFKAYTLFKADASSTSTMTHRPPGRELPAEGLEGVQRVEPPPPRLAGDWAGIYTPNPFWYQGGASQSSGAASANAGQAKDSPGIKLLRISAGRAQVQPDGARAEWVSDGGSIQGFQVTEIDADKQTCKVFSEKAGKVFTLRVGAG